MLKILASVVIIGVGAIAIDRNFPTPVDYVVSAGKVVVAAKDRFFSK